MDFLGIVSKQIVARLVELEVVLLRAFQVQNADRVVVRPEVFVSLVLIVRVFVQGVDEGEVNCLPSFVLIKAAWYEPFVIDGFFVLRETGRALSHSPPRGPAARRHSVEFLDLNFPRLPQCASVEVWDTSKQPKPRVREPVAFHVWMQSVSSICVLRAFKSQARTVLVQCVVKDAKEQRVKLFSQKHQ